MHYCIANCVLDVSDRLFLHTFLKAHPHFVSSRAMNKMLTGDHRQKEQGAPTITFTLEDVFYTFAVAWRPWPDDAASHTLESVRSARSKARKKVVATWAKGAVGHPKKARDNETQRSAEGEGDRENTSPAPSPEAAAAPSPAAAAVAPTLLPSLDPSPEAAAAPSPEAAAAPSPAAAAVAPTVTSHRCAINV